MKKRILFKTDEDMYIFEDRLHPGAFYCMDHNNLVEELRIVSEYDNDEEKVSEIYTINVYPMEYTGKTEKYSDVYRISSSKTITFPVNRIKWLWIQII